MKTIKRTIPELDTSVTNINKFFNQFEFKGISEPSNIFAADQNSFEDAKNVYIDDDQFVSRNPLQKDIEIPNDAIPYLYDLIDYLVIGDNKLYISKNKINNNIIVNLLNDSKFYTIGDITQYHISSIEHYIICFNDKNAKVFDASSPDVGWQDLNSFVEIPVIKRVVGSQITEYPKNAFTENYKEEYIWSNESQPNLPNLGLPALTFNTYAQMIEFIQHEGINEFLPIDSVVYVIENSSRYKWTGTEMTLILNYEVKLNTQSKSYNWTIPNIEKLTDYKILRDINITLEPDDIFSVANDIICIARKDYFLVSFNGNTFSTVYYPLYSGRFLNIASISEDGKNFFFVASDGVYRCNLGTLEWGDKLEVYDQAEETTIKYTGKNNICKFLSSDVFVFLTYAEEDNGTSTNIHSRLYWKGPGLYMGNSAKDSLGGETWKPYIGYTDLNKSGQINMQVFNTNKTYTDCDKNRLYINVSSNSEGVYSTIIAGLFNIINDSTQSVLYLIRPGVTDASGELAVDNSLLQAYDEIDMSWAVASGMILSLTQVEDTASQRTFELNLMTLISSNEASVKWSYGILTYKRGTEYQFYYKLTDHDKWFFIKDYYNDGAFFRLSGGYIYNNLLWPSNLSDFSTSLPTRLDNVSFMTNRKNTWIVGDHFYVLDESGQVFTNYLLNNDTATIVYTHFNNSQFNKIPDISYSDTELYLAFGDTLQITENSKDGTKILFNLPPKNTQAFINIITAMINISTTEVALFFENKIVICSKVEDQNLGYRYDYYNTKLSLGVRLGDSVINTLEGSYTIFPTKRGLAVMNYQAFMATTDQVIEYITDNVKNLWDKFYKNSSIIKIIQWRNYLVFTNNSKDILLYNIKTQTWWRWEVPFNTLIAITDQLDLRLICRGELNIFTDKYLVNNEDKQLNYYDFSANGENIVIDWFVQSQPLHMNAPNYYKNLRQLIFQLFTDNEEFVEPTILAQIKLYRKKITLREPEVVKFTIEKLRTFVKRFNYWKINEVQWGLANDTETNNPAKFRLNGISIKYEIGEEVR